MDPHRGKVDIPAFFKSKNDGYVLDQIMKHYLDGTLPEVVTADRAHMDEWSETHVQKHDEAGLQQPCG